VIHCIVLFLTVRIHLRTLLGKKTTHVKFFTSQTGKGSYVNQCKGESSLGGFSSPHVSRDTAPKSSAGEGPKEALTATNSPNTVAPRADGLEAQGKK